MNRFVQSAVMLSIWWALLVDVFGCWAGQQHYVAWLPIIDGTVVMLIIAHLTVAWRYFQGPFVAVVIAILVALPASVSSDHPARLERFPPLSGFAGAVGSG